MHRQVLTGQQLLKLRQRLGWSQIQMASRLECTVEALQTIESSPEENLSEQIKIKVEHIQRLLADAAESLREQPQAEVVMSDQGYDQLAAKDLDN